MRIINDPAEMQRVALDLRTRDETIGLVPTMGALHEGHLSLMRAAVNECSVGVASIYVNPTQFGAGEDFGQYPRDLEGDAELSRQAGAEYIFAPGDRAMYPRGYATFVNVDRVTERLCGMDRPGHFRGVTTVVTKLFNIVLPHKAYFGQKDAQQTVVIRRLAADLNMPVEIREMPIVREPDGVAMSSRNKLLSPEHRKKAVVLYRSLQKADEMIGAGERNAGTVIETMTAMIDSVEDARIDYVSIVDADELEPLDTVAGNVLIALAVRFGSTRLIDNIKLAV
jgi:pantoate--beta-alanine ligase